MGVQWVWVLDLMEVWGLVVRWVLMEEEWIPDSREWIPDSKEWIPDSKEWIPDNMGWILDSKVWILDNKWDQGWLWDLMDQCLCQWEGPHQAAQCLQCLDLVLVVHMVLTAHMEVLLAPLLEEVYPLVPHPILEAPCLTKVQYLAASVVLVQPTPQPPAQSTHLVLQVLVLMVLQQSPALHTLAMVAGTLHLTQAWEDLGEDQAQLFLTKVIHLWVDQALLILDLEDQVQLIPVWVAQAQHILVWEDRLEVLLIWVHHLTWVDLLVWVVDLLVWVVDLLEWEVDLLAWAVDLLAWGVDLLVWAVDHPA